MSVAVCFGQLKHDANWCFGEGAGMHFNEDGTVDIFHCETSNSEANATFSDSNGVLLFYVALNYYSRQTVDLLDANHDLLANGGGLTLESSNTNGGFFIPNYKNSTINYYYLGSYFDTLDASSYQGLLSARLSFNGNEYVVDNINQLLARGNLQEKMAVTKSAEPNCWWILAHQGPNNGCSNGFVTLKVCDGIVVDSFIQYVGAIQCDLSSFYGELTFSDNGSLLVNPVGDESIIEVYDFDRCNGVATLQHQISGFRQFSLIYGIEITWPNIYITELGTTSDSSILYQYNLDDSVLTVLYAFDSFRNVTYQLQKAPNGKIYLAHVGLFSNLGLINNSTQCLSVIHNPDQLGLACNFEPFGFCFPDSVKMNAGLPNFPNYNLGPEGVFLANAGKDTTLCSNTNSTGVKLGAPPVPIVTYLWRPAIGLSATNIAQPIANPAQSTWYYLTATDTTATTCAVNTDSVFVKVETCTGITETPTLQAKLYPNPTNGLFTVEVPQGTGGYTFRLFNLLGQQVLEHPLQHDKTTFPLDFAKGIYLYQITAHSGQVKFGKLVVE